MYDTLLLMSITPYLTLDTPKIPHPNTECYNNYYKYYN